jgi:hypothetical protein
VIDELPLDENPFKPYIVLTAILKVWNLFLDELFLHKFISFILIQSENDEDLMDGQWKHDFRYRIISMPR